jgi:hypothetical protein
MPRAIHDLFKLAKASDEMNWRFSLTYVEIYNERIKDLLNPGHTGLDVRECPKRGNVCASPPRMAPAAQGATDTRSSYHMPSRRLALPIAALAD